MLNNTNTAAAKFARNTFARDCAKYDAIAQRRKAENAAARARMQSNAELCAVLLAAALRRGEAGINWPEYFRNQDVAQ